MFKIGQKQNLKAVKNVDFGVYFACEDAPEERVLLPKKEVPADLTIGDSLDLFLYKDSNDRLIATVRSPKAYVGSMTPLTVKSVTKIGAFLDWGLDQ